jgi:hypothetical protein
MKHLKRFNEGAFEADEKFTSLDKIREFDHELNTTLFTPKAEQVPLRTLYKVIVVRTQEPISTCGFDNGAEPFQSHAAGVPKIYDTNWILLSFRFGKFGISFYPDENTINNWLKSGYLTDFRDYLMLDYNDINHAEIENILLKYGVVVDEMWGIPL